MESLDSLKSRLQTLQKRERDLVEISLDLEGKIKDVDSDRKAAEENVEGTFTYASSVAIKLLEEYCRSRIEKNSELRKIKDQIKNVKSQIEMAHVGTLNKETTKTLGIITTTGSIVQFNVTQNNLNYVWKCPNQGCRKEIMHTSGISQHQLHCRMKPTTVKNVFSKIDFIKFTRECQERLEREADERAVLLAREESLKESTRLAQMHEDDANKVVENVKKKARRQQYTTRDKLQVLNDLEEKEKRAKEKNNTTRGLLGEVADDWGINHSILSKWRSEKASILKESKQGKNTFKVRESAPKFPLAEDAVLKEFFKSRQKGFPILSGQLQLWMKREYKRFYPNDTSGFKAGAGWAEKFRRRNRLVQRRRTEKKNLTIDQRIGKICRFHQGISIRTSSGENAEKDSVFGRFPPNCRLNIDQSPLSLADSFGTTLEVEGATTVHIASRTNAEKRYATLQLFIVLDNVTNQPPTTIIFRGKGNISNAERNMYDKRVCVLFQDKAWMDSELLTNKFCPEVLFPYVDKMVEGEKLLFLDNLKCQTNFEFVSSCRKKNIKTHFFPPNTTDLVQPIDRGIAQYVKTKMKELIGQKLLDDENFSNKWFCRDGQKMTACETRIFIVGIAAEAWDQVKKSLNFQDIGYKTGCLIPRHDAPPGLYDDIKIPGLHIPYTWRTDLSHSIETYDSEDEDNDVEINLLDCDGTEEIANISELNSNEQQILGEYLPIAPIGTEQEFDEEHDLIPLLPTQHNYLPCPEDQFLTFSSMNQKFVIWHYDCNNEWKSLRSRIVAGPADPDDRLRGITFQLSCKNTYDKSTPTEFLGEMISVAFTAQNYGRRWAILSDQTQNERRRRQTSSPPNS